MAAKNGRIRAASTKRSKTGLHPRRRRTASTPKCSKRAVAEPHSPRRRHIPVLPKVRSLSEAISSRERRRGGTGLDLRNHPPIQSLRSRQGRFSGLYPSRASGASIARERLLGRRSSRIGGVDMASGTKLPLHEVVIFQFAHSFVPGVIAVILPTFAFLYTKASLGHRASFFWSPELIREP
eukprot:scaffold3148_cov275-Pinguiococcus_pyrenoidosus.AAC.3